MLRSYHPSDDGLARIKRSPNLTKKLLLALIATGIGCALALEITGRHDQLPLFAAATMTASIAIAAIAWLTGSKRTSADMTSWDLAGALAFVSFATAMIAN